MFLRKFPISVAAAAPPPAEQLRAIKRLTTAPICRLALHLAQASKSTVVDDYKGSKNLGSNEVKGIVHPFTITTPVPSNSRNHLLRAFASLPCESGPRPA